jgi:hypothetical protein
MKHTEYFSTEKFPKKQKFTEPGKGKKPRKKDFSENRKQKRNED